MACEATWWATPRRARYEYFMAVALRSFVLLVEKMEVAVRVSGRRLLVYYLGFISSHSESRLLPALTRHRETR